MPFFFQALLKTVLAGLITALIALPATAARTSLERGLSGEPNTLDPHKMKLLAEVIVLRDLFQGLTKSDADGNIVPGVAQGWEVSTDGKVYTFHLRAGLKWSDGQDLSADDFVAGYQRLFDPATAAQAAAFLYTIKNGQAVNGGTLPVEALGVTAPDAGTVRIELRAPNPAFPTLILSGYTSPFPRHAFAAYGADWVKPENFVSNGPFMMETWSPHEHIKLIANPHYHNAGDVALTRVTFHPTSDGAASVKRFRAGELDIAGGIPVSDVEKLKKQRPGEVRTFADLATLYLVPNMETDGLKDVRVRRALSLGLDRKVLTEKVLRGMGIPAYRFTPLNVSHYAPADMALKTLSMDQRRDQARAFLAEAGFGPGNPLKIQLRTTESREARNTVVALRAMWQQIGVETEIFNTEIKTHYADLSSGNFEIAVASYYGWDDPNEFLSLFTATMGQMSFNYGRYDNPLFDATINEALEIADIAARHARMADAEKIMLDDLAVIPLYFPINRALVGAHISGYNENRLNVHPDEFLSITGE